jgi:hypothetical protein
LIKINFKLEFFVQGKFQCIYFLHASFDVGLFFILILALLYHTCHNSNIEFVTKCGVQEHMRPRVCLGIKHALTSGGKWKEGACSQSALLC